MAYGYRRPGNETNSQTMYFITYETVEYYWFDKKKYLKTKIKLLKLKNITN